jgi:microcin C transport system substrate-binding protein
MLRSVVTACLLTVVGLAAASTVTFAGKARHGLSEFGDLKYSADFKHFDYVNPAAPKGSRLTTVSPFALSTFDSFNPFILKGDSPAEVASLMFDTLMARAMDEPDSYYGLVAEGVTTAADRMSVVFKLRAEAKFSNATPITADDCVFSLTAMKEKGHPLYRVMLRDVVRAEAIDAVTVKYTFDGTQVRSLPGMVAGLPIFSKAQFTTRAFDESGLEPLVGSGPYKIGDYRQGTFITYVRRPDYWAVDLPVMRGRFNFDEIRVEYFKERVAGIQAVKAGLLDMREEFTSKEWVTGYEIAAVAEKRLRLESLPDRNPSGTQGYWINTRKAKFADIRVRRALDLAFDFEWTNKNLFYGMYTRTTSFFENSAMKAEGLPSQAELKLLEPFRATLPSTVFESVYVPPVSDATGNDRKLMREAAKLLSEAGYEIKNGQRVNAKGEPFEIEFLIVDSTSERILAPYVKNLQALGFVTQMRKVDSAQYERRRKSFDYDIVTARFSIGLTPGPELRGFFGGDAATTEGSSNLSGIKDPVVDHFIGLISSAPTRDVLVTAARALDRVLRANQYWVPQWYKASHSIVSWDKFGRPPIKPAYDRGIIDTWWLDPEKAARLKQN